MTSEAINWEIPALSRFRKHFGFINQAEKRFSFSLHKLQRRNAGELEGNSRSCNAFIALTIFPLFLRIWRNNLSIRPRGTIEAQQMKKVNGEKEKSLLDKFPHNSFMGLSSSPPFLCRAIVEIFVNHKRVDHPERKLLIAVRFLHSAFLRWDDKWFLLPVQVD